MAPNEHRLKTNQSLDRRRGRVLIEWLFGLTILIAIFGLVRNVIVLGYLPDPFLFSKSETFTDWYNPAYWTYNKGTYSDWGSIYPPLSFVFLRLFTNERCYTYGIDSARECDPTGIVVLSSLMIVNFGLAWWAFHKRDKYTALPRALAVGLGFPALYAWERGNLVVPCFTAYILAYGNVLKSARLKALLAAITINFKPYLLLSLAGHVVKRKWTWLEWCTLWIIALYGVTFAIFGSGDPMTIFYNSSKFEHTPGVDLIAFTTTYEALLTILQLPLPLTGILGTAPIETAEAIIPVLIYAGLAGSLICLGYATLSPKIFPQSQISALLLILFMSVSTSAGGYALHFALFFIFLQSWEGNSRIFVLIFAYFWCIPFDYPVFYIFQDYGYSFLGQRYVYHDLALTWGNILRPLFLLLMEYGLVWMFACRIWDDAVNRLARNKSPS